MNGIDRIIAKIQADSAAECEKIAKEAEAEAGRIKERCARLEQEEYWKLVNVGTKEAEQRLEQLSGLAEIEAKKQILATRQALVEKAFDRAADILAEMPANKYMIFLARLAARASLRGTEEIILSLRDARRFGNRIVAAANELLISSGKTGSLSLSNNNADIRGGLILSGEGFEANCSIDALIEQCKDELASDVAAELLI